MQNNSFNSTDNTEVTMLTTMTENGKEGPPAGLQNDGRVAVYAERFDLQHTIVGFSLIRTRFDRFVRRGHC